jgi:hypothetical protein
LSLEEKPALGFVAEASLLRGGRGHVPADELSLEEKPALGFVAEASFPRGGRGNVPADENVQDELDSGGHRT